MGGVKSFCCEGSKQWGDKAVAHFRRSNGNALGGRVVGRGFESWSADTGAGATVISPVPGFEPSTEKSAVACITIRPLPRLTHIMLATA